MVVGSTVYKKYGSLGKCDYTWEQTEFWNAFQGVEVADGEADHVGQSGHCNAHGCFAKGFG